MPTTSVPSAVAIAAESAVDSSSERADLQRTIGPSASWWRTPTIVSSQAFGLLLLISFWLPFAEGCQGHIISPSGMFPSDPLMTWSDWLVAMLVPNAFFNGVWVAGLLLLTGIFHCKKIWQTGFALHLCLSAALLILMVYVQTGSVSDRKSGLEAFLGMLPVVTLPTLWVGWSIWKRQWSDVWARLQHVWTFVAIALLHVSLMLSRRLLFGYFFLLAGLLGMVVAVEVARNRMAHDLWDRSQPVGKFNFTIRGLMGWTTVLALVIGYYQTAPLVIERLFGPEE